MAKISRSKMGRGHDPQSAPQSRVQGEGGRDGQQQKEAGQAPGEQARRAPGRKSGASATVRQLRVRRVSRDEVVMGLDTTHDCWHGAYSAFGRWRTRIAACIGLTLSEMFGFGGDKPWPSPTAEPLVYLLDHSDCDGEIEAKHCTAIADRLEALLPHLDGFDVGHIGCWRDKTQHRRASLGSRVRREC